MIMIILTQILFDSHKNIFSLKIPFTRKAGETFKIVLDPNKITSMKESVNRNYKPKNEDSAPVTTLTMYNRRKIYVTESISIINTLIDKKVNN